MKSRKKFTAVLTIAGSDSGAGAGIQADLKTFTKLRLFGTNAVTSVTAQNPESVNGIQPIDPDLVAEQIRTICDAFPIAAAKTGMLYSAAVIRMVARLAVECKFPILVVDPVMVASSGACLLQEEAVETLLGKLFPLATVITPNIPEAELILRHPIKSLADMKKAATDLGKEFKCACVLKGGHLHGGSAVDILYWNDKLDVRAARKEKVEESHGTGCTFSAAMTAFLAKGRDIQSAFHEAKKFVISGLKHRIQVGNHFPMGTGLN